MARLTALFLVVVVVAQLLRPQPVGAASVIATIPVGSGTADIAVNPITNMIYVLNWRDETVSVIDGSTNTVTATIPLVGTPISIAVNPTTNTIYTGNSDKTVQAIDGATNALLATIPITFQGYPITIDADPATNRIYVGMNGRGDTVWVIDGTTNTLTAKIPDSPPQ
jgi:YVTN family beta-propeller protein